MERRVHLDPATILGQAYSGASSGLWFDVERSLCVICGLRKVMANTGQCSIY